jgi:hypothetical protein
MEMLQILQTLSTASFWPKYILDQTALRPRQLHACRPPTVGSYLAWVDLSSTAREKTHGDTALLRPSAPSILGAFTVRSARQPCPWPPVTLVNSGKLVLMEGETQTELK